MTKLEGIKHDPRNARTNIYVLVDPNTQDVRYVGKADDVDRRLRDHLGHCKDRGTHCQRWIAKLKDAGQVPVLVIVENVPVPEWPERERHWISHFESLGHPLTNTAPGGLGGQGVRHTDEYRQRMSALAKAAGRRPPPKTPEQIEKMRAEYTGRVHTSEAKQKISAHFKGKPLSAEHRAKLAERKREMFADVRERERLSRMWAVLTDDQVIEVWRLAHSGQISQSEIARKYGIPQSSVSEIKLGKRYKHVPRPIAQEGVTNGPS